MFKIGLTGGIASGKSTVLTYFKDKGIPYIDADIVAREVVEPGTKGLEAVVDAFGTDVLRDDGTLNSPSRSRIAKALPGAINSKEGRLLESSARIFALLISNCSVSFSEKVRIVLS